MRVYPMSTVTSSTNSSLSSLSSPGTAPAQSQALNLKTGTGEPPSPSIPVPVILDEKLLIEIVRASAIVSSEILEQVIDLARVSQRTILDVLFASGFIASSDYKAFIHCHNIIQTKVLFKPWAIACLQRTLSEFVPFEEMLEIMEMHPLTALSDSTFAALAISTQLVTAMEFEKARRLSLSSGLSIGQSCLKLGYLCHSSYRLMLDCFSLYRLGQADKNTLRSIVKAAGFDFMRRGRENRDLPLTQTLASYERLAGEAGLAAGLDLLVKASVLSESSLLALVEESLEQNVSFRAVFVDVSGFNIQVLDTAIKMAALVQSGDCAIDIAFTILQESVRQPLALRRS